MKKNLAALALCAAVASQAHATIVDHGDYLSDTVTGLDWLDVTKSANMSFDYVSTQFGAGGLFAGWRYATGNEFNALVGSYTGTLPTTYDLVSHNEGEIDGLGILLGSTFDQAYLSILGVTLDTFLGNFTGDPSTISDGIIADISPFGQNRRMIARFSDDDTFLTQVDFTQAHFFETETNIQNVFWGSFLIRPTTPVATNDVPEPSTVALLGLGLLGLAANRRKAKSK